MASPRLQREFARLYEPTILPHAWNEHDGPHACDWCSDDVSEFKVILSGKEYCERHGYAVMGAALADLIAEIGDMLDENTVGKDWVASWHPVRVSEMEHAA